jgi:hypothetical protein
VLPPRFDSSFYIFYSLEFLGTEEKIIGPLVLVLQSIACLCDVVFVEVAGAVFSTVLVLRVPLNKNGIQLKWGGNDLKVREVEVKAKCRM